MWGSLIGVFLAALSTGYFLGGRLADRWPSAGRFAGVVFLAGVLVLLIPSVAARMLETIAVADLGARAKPLVASFVLFFLPGTVLGMVSPYAVRLRARTVATIGHVAGQLYALSTAGSIVGTLLAAFVLLSYLDVDAIVYLLGSALVLLAVVAWGRASRQGLAAATAALAVVVGGTVLAGSHVLPAGVQFERDTVYHRITVADAGAVRYLKLDNYWQSAVDLAEPRRTVFAYTDYMHLPLIFHPTARRVLIIGLGGGTVPTRYAQDYPSMAVEVVELDPNVVAVAQRYFAQPGSSRVHVTVQDGRLFLAQSRAHYDIVLLDAYLIDTIPFHLATREFWETVRAHLAPEGVVAWNIIGALSGPRSSLFRAMYKTVQSVFPTVYVFPVDWGRYGSSPNEMRNIIVIGSMQPVMLPAAVARAAAQVRAAQGVTIERFEDVARDLYTSVIATQDVPVLSDDFAPVDTLMLRQ